MVSSAVFLEESPHVSAQRVKIYTFLSLLLHLENVLAPWVMCVQYIGGYSVHLGYSVHPGGYHEYIGGYHEYIGGIS